MLDVTIRELERAVQLYPHNFAAKLGLAKGHVRAGQQFKACRLLLGYMEQHPERGTEIDEALTYARSQFQHYELVPTGTYPQALGNLRKALAESGETSHPCISHNSQNLARPQTLAGALRAELETYFSGGEGRLEFLNAYKDTSATTAYSKEDQNHVLIIQESINLILLEPTFREDYIPIRGGFKIENNSLKIPENSILSMEGKIYILDRTKKGQSYNKPLKQKEVPENEGWLYSAEEDMTLLEDSAELKFALIAERQGKKRGDVRAMGFYLRQPEEITEDQLRALSLVSLDGDSDAYDGWDLVANDVQFARVAQK